ncbi:hypothetical protein ACP3WZ_26185, partial [Salmonella enterica]|uniref:hypothetical protein n=1 Tax=Salmonella enterica TaxID=28901 RepID=UPI003CF6A20D
ARYARRSRVSGLFCLAGNCFRRSCGVSGNAEKKMPESEKQQHFRLKKKGCGCPKCYKQDVNVTARKSRWTSSAADV